MKKRPLSKEYYKSKRNFYRALLIFWTLFAVVITTFNVITPKNIFEPSLVVIAVAISAIFATRLDALNENYALYNKDSEPIN
jgi:hypothetical protein